MTALRRRAAVAIAVAATLLSASCDDAPSAAGTAASDGTTPDVRVEVDAAAPGPAVNRRVLGSNVQWVDDGDHLLTSGTLNLDPRMQRLVMSMGTTVLRYPGGAQSDGYDWTHGIGSAAARGPNRQAGTHRQQRTAFGTAELLELAQAINAAPLFTVNLLTGTPEMAAAWVRQTNVSGLTAPSGAALPPVTYWEMGNEPYLPNPDGTHPESCEIDPVTYAARVDAFVRAMRAVDSRIRIGIALANDVQNGIAFVSPRCRHYTATVLDRLTQRVDFISVHDAYLPYDVSGKDHSASDEYWASMASTASLQRDLAALRQSLQAYPDVKSLPFALTEYNALWSLNPASAFIHSMASPLAALYMADVLRLFAGDDDVLLATAWSLSGNDHWGAIRPGADDPFGGPTYEVFRLFSEALQGRRLTVRVQAPPFNAPAVGFSAAAAGLPVITTLATAAAGTLRILLINKDLTRPHLAQVIVAHATVTAARLSVLTAADVFESDDRSDALQRAELAVPTSVPLTATLPAHSITLLTVQFTAAAT